MNDTSDGRWRQVGELFHELVALNSTEQMTRLDQIGESDPELRREVEALLAADQRAEERLARFDFAMAAFGESGSDARSSNADPLGLIGKTVSHFRVDDHLASGGMGVVYRASDTRLNRSVALKFPLPDDQATVAARERFVREARAVGALDHANLCAVYEAGDSDHGLFLAMPLYPGQTLKQRLTEGSALTLQEALSIARQIADGLACAHGAGIVHRDLKPGNIMLLPDGTVKILDFGLAKVGDLSLTSTGVALGTVSYMAPEQIRGRSVDARADLWSLGVLLYEMLTGTRPFSGEHEASIIHAILHDDPRPVAAVRPNVPRAIQLLVQALLQKDAGSRYAGAREVATDLAAIERGAPPAFLPPIQRRAMGWLRQRRRAAAALLLIPATAGVLVAAPRFRAALNKPTKNAHAYELYTRGREYERSGPATAAESLYLGALALDSTFALARARLAVVYAACRAGGSRDCFRSRIEDPRVDQLEQSRVEAEAALRQQPRLADAHFALGLYWERREDPVRAMSEFTLALKGMKTSAELRSAIGRAYRTQGRWEEAIRAFEQALSFDPQHVSSAFDLATTLSRLRRYEEAIRYWNRYLALAPDAYQGKVIKGNAYLRWQGTVDTLAAIFRQLPADWQRRSFTTRVLIARIQRRPADALAALDLAPRQAVEDPDSHNAPLLQRAQVYGDMGDSVRARAYYDTARVALERSVAERPGDFRRLVAVGVAYAGLGLAEQAKRAADSAMALMPASRSLLAGTTAMRGAAEIFAKLPEFHDRALALLEQLLQMPAGREVSVPLLRVDPAWNALRPDPRFQQLLAQYSR